MAGTGQLEFLALDATIITYIFEFLDSQDLLKTALTCKQAHMLALPQLQREREALLQRVERLAPEVPQHKYNKLLFAKIPIGLPSTLRKALRNHLAKPGDVIVFVNPEESIARIGSDEGIDVAVADAGLIVAEFLQQNVAFDCPKIWPVEFSEPEKWRKKAAPQLSSEKQHEEALVKFTEGVTPPKSKYSDDTTIYMNRAYFTTGAIVHEMFHSMQHTDASSIFKVGQYGNEATTELYTLLACGLDLRVSRAGGPYYPEARVLARALKNKILTLEELNRGYFQGDAEILQRIEKHLDENGQLLKRFQDSDWDFTLKVGSFLKQVDYEDSP